MVRSEEYKLLRNNINGQRLLFDLKKDPNEFEDIAADSSNDDICQAMTNALVEWQGGHEPEVHIYLDEDAPICHASNARPRDPELRKTVKEYYTKRFTEERNN
ncbi:MAG: hypothetical protein U5P10_12850 [Spirochaetia bacterium]|nr:hypothetical protein [Spirochaetia bacterium]